MLFQLLRKPVAKTKFAMMCSQEMDYNVSLWGVITTCYLHSNSPEPLSSWCICLWTWECSFLAQKKDFKHPTNTSIVNHLEGSGVSMGCLLLDYSVLCFHGFPRRLPFPAHNLQPANRRCSFCSTHTNGQNHVGLYYWMSHITRVYRNRYRYFTHEVSGVCGYSGQPPGSSGKAKESPDIWQTLASFVKKKQQTFWWVTDAFIIENSPDELLFWPEMTRPWHAPLAFSIQSGSHWRGRMEKGRGISVEGPRPNQLPGILPESLSVSFVFGFLTSNFIIIFI